MTEERKLENEIALLGDVTFTVPVITFPGYEAARKRAEEVAEYINSVNLTEDNLPEVKKMLANARKLVAALDDRRKDIKKAVTEPVKGFEEQIKDITGIIDGADSQLRAQVRAIEEKEREEKQLILQQLWDLRLMHYSFGRYIPEAFSMWLEPRHLNKSTTVRSAEDEMVAFMEAIEKDVAAILAMPESEDIMIEYAGTLNLADALEAVRQQREYREKAFESRPEKAEETAAFFVSGKANITLTEKLLQENGIEYRRK